MREITKREYLSLLPHQEWLFDRDEPFQILVIVSPLGARYHDVWDWLAEHCVCPPVEMGRMPRVGTGDRLSIWGFVDRSDAMQFKLVWGDTL